MSNMNIGTLRARISREEFDYEALASALTDIAYPRDAITRLLRKGVVVRVKKGLYVFGENYRRRPFSRELLANMVYGPSYISLEFALQYYGLIPERVQALTSVTTGRTTRFLTPVGLFSYRKISLEAFRSGFRREERPGDIAFLIALPEKALADKLQAERGVAIGTQMEVVDYLTGSLRMEESEIRAMDPNLLTEFANRYGSRRLLLLAKWVVRLRRRE